MKKLIVLLFILMLSVSSICFADYGTIVYVDESKDLIVVQSYPYYMDYFTCAEIQSIIYPYPEPGDIIYGPMTRYASNQWYAERLNQNFNVWVDEYWLSKDQVFDWLSNK